MWNWPENQIRLVMIRHGATKSNVEHRYLGRTDEPLCEEGKRQLAVYGKQKCYPAVDCLFISPMKRCVQTAEILYPDGKPVCVENWMEMDFGEFEGKNYLELKGNERYQRWIDSSGRLPFPGGESREDFILRCQKGFQEMISKARLRENSQEKKTIGIIAHGGTIMALLSSYSRGEYFDYQTANGRGYLCAGRNWNAKPELMVQKKI